MFVIFRWVISANGKLVSNWNVPSLGLGIMENSGTVFLSWWIILFAGDKNGGGFSVSSDASVNDLEG